MWIGVNIALCIGVRQVVLDDNDEAAVRAWVEQRKAFVKRLPDTGPGRPGGSASGAERQPASIASSSSAPAATAAAQTLAPKASPAAGSSIGFGKAPLGAVVRKRKAEAPPAAAAASLKKLEEVAAEKQAPKAQAINGDAGSDEDASAGGLAGLVGGYGSSSGSDGSPT